VRKNIVELAYCRARAARMRPDRADDSEKIGAGRDERPAILLGMPPIATLGTTVVSDQVAQQWG